MKTHDILREDLIQWHKSVGLLTYKIYDDHFRVTDPTCRLRWNQVVHEESLQLVVKRSRKVSKSAKYQELCHAVGMFFLPISGFGGAKVPGTL